MTPIISLTELAEKEVQEFLLEKGPVEEVEASQIDLMCNQVNSRFYQKPLTENEAKRTRTAIGYQFNVQGFFSVERGYSKHLKDCSQAHY